MSVSSSISGGGFGSGSGGLAAGPGTAIADNKVVRGDTTGIQGSGVDLSDADAMSGLTQLTCDNIRLDGHQVLDTGTGSSSMLIVNGGNNYIELRGSSGQTWLRNDGSGVSVGIDASVMGATSPNFQPSAADPNTGLARAGEDQLSLVAGGAEVARATSLGLRAIREVEASTVGSGAPNILLASESRKILTNEGAAAEAYNALPSAAVGLEYVFYCQTVNGIRIVAAAGDTIRLGPNVSAAAGFVRSEIVGSALVLVAINATEWVAISIIDIWTVDS